MCYWYFIHPDLQYTGSDHKRDEQRASIEKSPSFSSVEKWSKVELRAQGPDHYSHNLNRKQTNHVWFVTPQFCNIL